MSNSVGINNHFNDNIDGEFSPIISDEEETKLNEDSDNDIKALDL